MRVEPRALVRRLTPTATRLLEASVARGSRATHHEIVVEHFLLSLIERDDGDAARILTHFSADRDRFVARVERTVGALRSGNAGRPVFSETLFQWLEDAWVVASVELGAVRLRTGALLLQLAARADRYLAESFPELEKIIAEDLKRNFDQIVVGSAESMEAVPEAAPSASGSAVRTADSALERFTLSLNEQVKTSLDPIFGRHREVRQMIDILARRRKNNPVIVGEPGVGKTALVEGLARMIVEGSVPESLAKVELRSLDLGLLQAGAGVRGEFESRLKAVIAEVKASPRPIVLFIDEAHTLIGAGGQTGGSDAANLLKPALARGELRTIAATTWADYKEHFEKDPAMVRRFQIINVEEPSEETAITMIRGLRDSYEASHGVRIRDDGVVAAVKLSLRYISGRQLPDKAVDLLDTAAARVRVAMNVKPEAIAALEAEADALERARASAERDAAATGKVSETIDETTGKLAAIRDRLAQITARWEKERAAVLELKAAEDALAKSTGDAELKNKVTAARERATQLLGAHEEALVHPEVDAQVVAQVVSSLTGIPVGKMRRDMMAMVLDLESRLRDRVRGQDHALKAVADTIRIAHAGIRNPRAPVGVFLFVGPSGVGKTETGIALAETLYGGERFMVTINMSEFQEKHTVSRLIGSPPGYVGYGKGGVLTEAVRQRPYSVVLLDECEKADLEVMNLFYQVFDKGMLSDGTGRQIDFRNTIVILTSNLASDAVMRAYERDVPPTAAEVVAAIRPTLSKHFKPALLARMTIVPYAPISGEIMRDIIRMKISAVADRLRQSHRIETEFAPEVLDELGRRCHESEVGARNVDHALRDSLMPEIARVLLERISEGELGRRLAIGLSPSGAWRVDFSDA